MTDLTVNIRGLTVPTPDAAAALRALGSRWALVESNPGMARELAAQGWRIVYRDYWPEQGDDNLHLKVAPAAWFDHMAALGLPADAILIAGNEPTRLYPELVDWSLEAMRIARARGWRLAVGSFATGNPGEFDWDDALLPLLEALQDGWHVLSLHEYIATAFKVSVPWHIGRFKYALDACRVHGLNPPRLFITETGLDVTGSWQSLGLTASAFAAEVGQAVCEVWRPAGMEMAALFSLGAWSVDHGGHRWEFDVTPALSELARIGQEDVPVDETFTACTLKILSASGSRLRALPTTSGGIITVLPQGEHAAVCGNRQTNGGYTWAHVTVNGQTGWVALEATDGSMTTLAEVTPVESEPAPEPTPEPEPAPPDNTAYTEFLRKQLTFCLDMQATYAGMAASWGTFAGYVQEQLDVV